MARKIKEKGDKSPLIEDSRRRPGAKRPTEVQSSETMEDQHHLASDLRGDWLNIFVLLFLYILQGIPLGLAAAIPMLLQNRGISYKQQAEFSFAYWPFSLKLLWAPIVDSLFIQKFGRRKSWLIPTQYLIGGAMLLLSMYVTQWIGSETDEPNVFVLTCLFFLINFMAATQDIAVDGWALTMLKRCNVGHASTCNSVGQTAGYFLGYVVFIALESTTFCNTYLRTEPAEQGMITLAGFLKFWGVVFLITTTLVALFKHEREERKEDEHILDIKKSYVTLLQIIQMRPVQMLALILLTAKVAFSATDAVTPLKLIDYGVPKTKLALLAIPLVPLQIILPIVISKYTAGPRPMDVYTKAYPYRLIFTVTGTIVVALAPLLIDQHDVPIYYYVLLLLNYAFYQITLYSMFVAAMAFFAKISDPAVGGTYMTLLNTLCNLGGNWPNTLILWLTDVLTWRKCTTDETNLCLNQAEKDQCKAGDGTCDVDVDGYYLELLICLIFGIVWFRWAREKISQLQTLPVKAWHVVKRRGHHSR